MEAIKTVNEELRSQKSTSLLIGYVVVLAAMFAAFEYTTRDVIVQEEGKIYESVVLEEDMIPITQQQEIVAPPPQAAPKVAEIINIVDNETELPEEEIETSEEVNQAITTTVGTGAPGAVATGPVGPSICQEQGVQGRVTVSFVVNRDGSIVDVNVVRSPDEHLSAEAMRVVKLMPKWKPARQGNKTVRSRFMLPVLFRLG